ARGGRGWGGAEGRDGGTADARRPAAPLVAAHPQGGPGPCREGDGRLDHERDARSLRTRGPVREASCGGRFRTVGGTCQRLGSGTFGGTLGVWRVVFCLAANPRIL